MKNRFTVVIPVVNLDLFGKLIKSICENTLLPKRVILIDNSKESFGAIYNHIPSTNGIIYEVYYSKTGLVNESLNLGTVNALEGKSEYVSFLNDDVILNSLFFERLSKSFEELNCAAACPKTVNTMDEMILEPYNPLIMNKREGWALSVRKDVLEKISLFPSDRVATFHWDDWIWYHTLNMKLYWYKDTGNTIFHKVGASVAKLGFRSHKRKERNEFQQIAREKGWTA